MATRGQNSIPRPALLGPTFLATVLVGLLLVALTWVIGPLTAQIAVLGLYASVLIGLVLERDHRDQEDQARQMGLLRSLSASLALAPEHEFFDQYSSFARGLQQLARQTDPILREFVLLKLSLISGEVDHLARGTVVFSSTETWRTVYQKLLESLEAKAYYSVAWVKTADYWRDPPGQQSMALNYTLVQRGYRIERILILPDALWPFDEAEPSPEIRPWIVEQHHRGVIVSLVREHHLVAEPDLLCDFGIYGYRATGEQELDDQSRTVRFILHFDRHSLRLYHDRWERLSLYAKPYAETLDRNAGS